MVFQCINIRQVPREVFSTLPRDLANVNAWKNIFDPYIVKEINSLHILCLRQAFIAFTRFQPHFIVLK